MALIRRQAVGSLFSFVSLLCSFCLLPQFALAQGNQRNLQIGIDPRSNLTGETEESRQKILEGIHSLGATWVRDGFAKSSQTQLLSSRSNGQPVETSHLMLLA
jgi:hypothetical protein